MYDEAEKACKEKIMILATIENKEEWSFFKDDENQSYQEFKIKFCSEKHFIEIFKFSVNHLLKIYKLGWTRRGRV